MLFAEKELNIIEMFQDLVAREIMLLPPNDEVKSIVSAILDEKSWKQWVDSSAKDAPPPDFFCDEMSLMMDVMRVDDHGYKKKGNIINPTLAREHQIEKELKDKGFLEMFPNAYLHIIADTGLPTEEDHNYKFYRDNFIRTISKHIGNIPNYKKNHPEHKLIFFVFDESSAYLQKSEIDTQGFSVAGNMHFFFFDEAFVSVLKDAEVDYIIWFAPYKRFEYIEPRFELPKAVVCKVSELEKYKRIYDADKMVSSER